MKRRLILALTFVLVCALVLPVLASCDLFGEKSVWFCREDGDIEYYISFDEKAEEILVVVVDGKDAESYTFDYEIDDDEIEIKDAAKNKAVFTYKEKSESYVVIDGVKFKIADEGPDDYEEGDREFTVYELLGKLGEAVLSGTYLTNDGATLITFKADGSVSIKNSTDITVVTKTGRYEIKENKIAITVDGKTEEYSYSFESGKLTIDGVEYAPEKNSATTKPQDTMRPNEDAATIKPQDTVRPNENTAVNNTNKGDYTKEPEYSVHPDDDPHYTVPSYTEDEPDVVYPTDRPVTGAVDTTTQKDPSNGPFTATYETKDLGDGSYIRWLFLDDGSWIMYDMYGNEGEKMDGGKYYLRNNVLVVMSTDTNFEIDNFSIGEKIDVDGVVFYHHAPYADFPSNNGNADDTTEMEKPGFIGTYLANDDDGDTVTYLLVIDGGMYTVYSIDVWGNNAQRIDMGKYSENGNIATLKSAYKDGWNGKLIMKDRDILIFQDIHFFRTATAPEHPKINTYEENFDGENGLVYNPGVIIGSGVDIYETDIDIPLDDVIAYDKFVTDN